MNNEDKIYFEELLRKGTVETMPEFAMFYENADCTCTNQVRGHESVDFEIFLDCLGYKDCFCRICVDTTQHEGKTLYLMDGCTKIQFFNENFVEFDSLEALAATKM